MYRTVLFTISLFCLATLCTNFPLVLRLLLKLAAEKALLFKCSDPEDQSYRTSALPAVIWYGKTESLAC